MRIDRWEEGFDRWTPRADARRAGDASGDTTSGDTEARLQREQLLRLARELADTRNAEQQEARAELEQLKQSLRERAAAVAARERELADLQTRLESGKEPRWHRRSAGADDQALAARERAALERAQALDTRARELAARAVELEAENDRVSARERELEQELAGARERLAEGAGDRELAAAERERLEEREQAVHRVERELATRRVELEREREQVEARARDIEVRAAALGVSPELLESAVRDRRADDREEELRRLEAGFESRERELLRLRRTLDTERAALAERERALRERVPAERRQQSAPPFEPPSFGEGLAALARARTRR